MARRIARALAVGLALASPAAADDPTPFTACDLLAAHPWDPDRVAEGVAYEAIEPVALKACRSALEDHPASLRLAYQLGRALERHGYAGAALAHLRQAAEAGYAQAQYALGLLHAEGDGIPRDDAEAARWWRCAAARDHGPALAALELAHYDGRGASRYARIAFIMMRRAARKGFVQAQYLAGLVCLTASVGTTEDDAAVRPLCTESEATMWLATAANKGHAEARHALEELGLVGDAN